MRFLNRMVAATIALTTALTAQTNTKAASSPLSAGIARNQQELQELSTLIGQNNADMRAIVGDILVSLAGAVAGAGPESAFGQSPREALTNLISSYQRVKGALDAGNSALDGDAWLALSGQLKLALDLIGETELPVRFANTATDLLVKTTQMVSLARQNANLVAVKVQVARAQTYLLARAAAIQARRVTAQQTAAQGKLLPQIKTLAEMQSQWLLQQYKDRPQVIQLAVKTSAASNSRTVSQVVNGIQAAGGNSDVFKLSRIPGINPDVIAAMNRCNQIALTMVQRQATLTTIMDSCPKPAKPGDDPPPCAAYEAAAIANDAINRSSMTCNKDANGQYIPFFSSSSRGQGPGTSSIAGGWKMLPDSYFTGDVQDPQQLQQRRIQNAGMLYVRSIGPGHFQYDALIGSKSYPVDLSGSDEKASGDRDVVIESTNGRNEVNIHIEASLSDGKLYFTRKDKRTATQSFNPGQVWVFYSEEHTIAAPASTGARR